MAPKFLIFVLVAGVSLAQFDVSSLGGTLDRCEICCQDSNQDLLTRGHVPERLLEGDSPESSTSSSEASSSEASSASRSEATSASDSSSSSSSASSSAESSTASSAEGSHGSSAEGSHESSHGSSHASGHGSGHHDWWSHDYEYAHFEAWVIVALVLTTLVFDEIHHKTEEWAEHAGNDGLLKHFLDHHKHKLHTTNMWEELHNRASGELAVLGFLALLVWCCNQGGLFDRLSKMNWYWDTDSLAMPSTPTDYLHTVENVHMHLFISMAIYFLFTGIVLMCASVFIPKAVNANYDIKQDWRKHKILEEKEEQSLEQQRNALHKYYKKNKSRIFRMFFQLREYYFQSLEMWRDDWPFLADHLKGMKEHLLRNAEISEERRAALYSPNGTIDFDFLSLGHMMRKWFPFDLYVIVNYRHTICELLEISRATWFLILSVLFVDGMVQQNVHSPIYIRLAALIGSQFVIFAMIVTVLWLWINAKRRVKGSVTGRLAKRSWIHNIHPVAQVVRILQVCMFFSVYELASTVANKSEWDKHFDGTLVVLIVLMLGVFGEGLLVGILLPLYSVLITTGPYMQEEHVERLQAIVKVYSVNNPLRLRQLVENIEEFDEVVAENEEEFRKSQEMGDFEAEEAKINKIVAEEEAVTL